MIHNLWGILNASLFWGKMQQRTLGVIISFNQKAANVFFLESWNLLLLLFFSVPFLKQTYFLLFVLVQRKSGICLLFHFGMKWIEMIYVAAFDKRLFVCEKVNLILAALEKTIAIICMECFVNKLVNNRERRLQNLKSIR